MKIVKLVWLLGIEITSLSWTLLSAQVSEDRKAMYRQYQRFDELEFDPIASAMPFFEKPNSNSQIRRRKKRNTAKRRLKNIKFDTSETKKTDRGLSLYKKKVKYALDFLFSNADSKFLPSFPGTLAQSSKFDDPNQQFKPNKLIRLDPVPFVPTDHLTEKGVKTSRSADIDMQKTDNSAKITGNSDPGYSVNPDSDRMKIETNDASKSKTVAEVTYADDTQLDNLTVEQIDHLELEKRIREAALVENIHRDDDENPLSFTIDSFLIDNPGNCLQSSGSSENMSLIKRNPNINMIGGIIVYIENEDITDEQESNEELMKAAAKAKKAEEKYLFGLMAGASAGRLLLQVVGLLALAGTLG